MKHTDDMTPPKWDYGWIFAPIPTAEPPSTNKPYNIGVFNLLAQNMVGLPPPKCNYSAVLAYTATSDFPATKPKLFLESVDYIDKALIAWRDGYLWLLPWSAEMITGCWNGDPQCYIYISWYLFYI